MISRILKLKRRGGSYEEIPLQEHTVSRSTFITAVASYTSQYCSNPILLLDIQLLITYKM